MFSTEAHNSDDEIEYSGAMIASHGKTAVVDFCNTISEVTHAPGDGKYNNLSFSSSIKTFTLTAWKQASLV